MESNDVHIVLDPQQLPEARRAAWEAEQQRRVLDAQVRAMGDLAARDSFEAEAEQVRRECAARYAGLIQWLEPYVDGTMGEVTVGLAAVYRQSVRDLASLYGLQRGRRPVASLPVLPEPEAVAGAAERVVVEQRAVVERVASVRDQLSSVREKMLAITSD